MCGADRDDGDDFRVAVKRTARTVHTCYACSETIRPGDRYNVFRSLYDGYWTTLKHCARCWAMVKILCNADFGSGTVVLSLDCGDTWEDASGSPPPDDVAALAFWLPGDPLPGMATP